MSDWKLDVVRRAREIISVPQRWTKGDLGRDSKGSSVLSDEVARGAAARVCAVGSLIAAAGETNFHEASSIADDIEFDLQPYTQRIAATSNIVFVNDKIGRKKVIEVFDAYIADKEEHDGKHEVMEIPAKQTEPVSV